MAAIIRKILRPSLALIAAFLVGATASFVLAQTQPSSTAAQNAGAAQAAITSETPFLKENETAMNKMMADMTVKPTGDVNRDFVAMMSPHHQGAIDMAKAYLRYGSNEQLRRIAQEIVVDQQQEIVAMRLAVGEPLPPSAPSPTQVPAAPATTPQTAPQPAPGGMMMQMSPGQMNQMKTK